MTDLKKIMVMVDIKKRWGKRIAEEGEITSAKVEDRLREIVVD